MINLNKNSFLGIYLHLLYDDLPTSKAGVVIKSILPIPLFPLILVTWLVYFTVTLIFDDCDFIFKNKKVAGTSVFTDDGLTAIILTPIVLVCVSLLLMVTDIITQEGTIKSVFFYGTGKTLLGFFCLGVIIKLIKISYKFTKRVLGGDDDQINWK